jgi:hypothetical protein
MILTKEIEIRIAGNGYNYYRENNIDVIPNKVNRISIEMVNPKSHFIIDAKCDICGKEVKVQLRRYNQSFNNGGYYTCSSRCGTEKRKMTFNNKYGCEIPFKTDNFKEKTKQSMLEKYGSTHFRQSNVWKLKNLKNEKKIRKDTIFQNFLIENPSIIGQNEDNFIVKCEIHGENKIPKKIFSNRKKIGTELCVICKPIESNISGKEVLLFKLIKEIYDGEIIKSYKIKRKEIDVFLPELNIGFEFNGLYWHSNKFLDNNYHIEKTILCEKNKIRLVHIFEDDFDNKNDIVKSIVMNILGKTTKIFGRKTEVKKISSNNDVKDFLIKNHLQGFVNSNINYGLYYNNELVSIMTFMKSRKILGGEYGDGNYELVRFCNKLNYSVVGGASKLFKHFVSEYSPKNVTSYCDISWGSGNLYEKIGMKYEGLTKPNYHYVIDGKRESRIKYQKHKLVKQGFSKDKTEKQIMDERGIYSVYNCGNKIYRFYNLN